MTGEPKDDHLFPAKPRSWRISLLRIVLIAVATYVCLAILLFVLQRSLIYYPLVEYDGVPSDVGLAYEDVSFVADDGVQLSGWYVPRENAFGTVLFFHGNGGNISHRLHKLEALNKMGLAVLIIDYRGYGASAGRPSEAGLYRDAYAAWMYLVEGRGERAGRIVLLGESLGGAVAVDLAVRQTPGALVLESTFTSMAELAKVHYPYFPVKWLLREKYDSIQKIRNVRCPVLVLHGDDDELVPPLMAKALFEAAPGPKRLIETPGGHNESGFTYTPDYAEMMKQFLQSVLSGQS